MSAAWDLWLDCLSERQIAERIGVDQATVNRWKDDALAQVCADASPPDSRQHFDVWSFQTADDDAGAAAHSSCRTLDPRSRL